MIDMHPVNVIYLYLLSNKMTIIIDFEIFPIHTLISIENRILNSIINGGSKIEIRF